MTRLRHTVSMRRFGVEIEAGLQAGRTLGDVQRVLAEAGLGGSVHSYSGFSPTYWVVKRDGSVPGGVEVVSPPLDFDDEAQRGQVDRAMEAIRTVCRTERSAGIHVHIEREEDLCDRFGCTTIPTGGTGRNRADPGWISR